MIFNTIFFYKNKSKPDIIMFINETKLTIGRKVMRMEQYIYNKYGKDRMGKSDVRVKILIKAGLKVRTLSDNTEVFSVLLLLK